MIRQAHTYLVGALGGATLIAIAIAAFVMLVSAQVFTDWPLAGLGKSSDNGVSAAKVVDAPEGGAPADAAGNAATAATATTTNGAKAGSGSGDGANAADGAGATVDESRDNAEAGAGESTGGGESGGGSGGGGDTPAAPTSPASSGGGSTPSPAGGGSGGGSSGGGSSTTSSPAQTVTSTVNETVTKVDQTVTGGALEKTGVTGVTEGVVDGVAGPESVVGNVVDETVGTVEGILGGKR
jgi:hypothetical protein